MGNNFKTNLKLKFLNTLYELNKGIKSKTNIYKLDIWNNNSSQVFPDCLNCNLCYVLMFESLTTGFGCKPWRFCNRSKSTNLIGLDGLWPLPKITLNPEFLREF